MRSRVFFFGEAVWCDPCVEDETNGFEVMSLQEVMSQA